MVLYAADFRDFGVREGLLLNLSLKICWDEHNLAVALLLAGHAGQLTMQESQRVAGSRSWELQASSFQTQGSWCQLLCLAKARHQACVFLVLREPKAVRSKLFHSLPTCRPKWAAPRVKWPIVFLPHNRGIKTQVLLSRDTFTRRHSFGKQYSISGNFVEFATESTVCTELGCSIVAKPEHGKQQEQADLYANLADRHQMRMEVRVAANACRGHSAGWNHRRKRKLTSRRERCPMGKSASSTRNAAAFTVRGT